MKVTSKFIKSRKIILDEKQFKILYPYEKSKISFKFRGEPLLRREAKGKERCTGCKRCEKICPTNAIKISVRKEKNKEYTVSFDVDLTKCIFCGLCEEKCPTGAVAISPNFEFAKFVREELMYNKNQLLANGERWEYSIVKRNENS